MGIDLGEAHAPAVGGGGPTAARAVADGIHLAAVAFGEFQLLARIGKAAGERAERGCVARGRLERGGVGGTDEVTAALEDGPLGKAVIDAVAQGPAGEVDVDGVLVVQLHPFEGTGRGAYTGSLGWLGSDGDADFNILIRTLTQRGVEIELRAGAGIVADSVPERELEETRAKARGMLRAFVS